MGFKQFFESHQKMMNYLGTIDQEFGMDELPITISSPLEVEYDGKPIVFNQVVLVPAKSDENDKYIKLKYFNANQSNRNFTRPYIKLKNGELRPYQGVIQDGTEFTVPRNIVSKLTGKPFEDTVKQNAGGMGT